MVALFLSLVLALSQVQVLETGPAGSGLGTRSDRKADTIRAASVAVPIARLGTRSETHGGFRSCPFVPSRSCPAPGRNALDAFPEYFNKAESTIDIAAIGPNPKTGRVHAKVVIADGRTILLGSATFSQRQLQECRNVGVLLTDSAVGATLEDLSARNWFSVFCRRP